MKITVIGLGVKSGDLSVRAYRWMEQFSGAIIVKTEHSPTYEGLEGFSHTSCDDLYDEAADFTKLDAAIVKRLLYVSKEREVCYLVPGNGVTDASVRLLLRKTKDVEIIAACDYAPSVIERAPCSSYMLMSAYEAVSAASLPSDAPLVIYEVDNRELAGDVKLSLMRFFDDQTRVYCSQRARTIAVAELDRLSRYDQDTCFFIPQIPLLEKKRFVFDDLMQIMDMLTAEDGCPWDRAQTHTSIRTNLVEEAYEAVDAIDQGDTENMVEEFGDVLLQAVFHSVIADNAEEFDIGDVLTKLCTKLLFRHPHVFGTVKAADAGGALSSWEAAKAVEKRQETLSDSLRSVPTAFPQTLRAVKIAKRSTKAGIGADIDQQMCIELATDRIGQLAEASPQAERVLGEALYAVANLARLLHLDPEIALKLVNDRYMCRAEAIEARLHAQGKSIYDASAHEIDRAVCETVYQEASYEDR